MATLAVATTYSLSSIAPLKARCRFGFRFGSFLSSNTKLKCSSIATTTTLAVATDPTVSVNPNSNPNRVLLPSNESSERLLRIRHTVMGKPILWLLGLFVFFHFQVIIQQAAAYVDNFTCNKLIITK